MIHELHHAGVRFAAAAVDRRIGARLMLVLIGVYVVAWTVIFAIVRSGQGPNEDSMEAYAWGRLFLWGYGKHPPMSGWIARIWFSVFPTSDWAMFALAFAVLGLAVWAGWALALRVVERRRAVLFALVLMIYPVFNVRGSRYTPDLLLAPLFVLAVLAFVIAFRRRTLFWGILLGTVCAGAALTKYSAMLVIGAIGMAALAHPQRSRFFRSPTPYAAVATFMLLTTPHLVWLVQSDYAPIEHAMKHTLPKSHGPLAQTATTLLHHLAMLLPVAVVLAWAIGGNRVHLPGAWRTVRPNEAKLVWAVVAFLVLVPPAMTVPLGVYFASDWGIPLYPLVPLAVLAMPSLAFPLRAPGRAAMVWLVALVAAVILSPAVLLSEVRSKPERYRFNEADLADKVTRLWHERNASPLPVVAAGHKRIAAAISFYSPDHPLIFPGFDPRLATWIDLDALPRSGFVAVCEAGMPLCEAAAIRLGSALQQVQITPAPNRFSKSSASPSFTVFIASPAR